MHNNIIFLRHLFIFFCIVFTTTTFTIVSAAKPPIKPTQPLVPPAPFTLEKPAAWVLSQAGECDTLTLFLRNPAEPLQQLFFFPRFGPVYINPEQKFIDLQQEAISGKSLNRLDMPVVHPFTPENFVRFLPQVFQTKAMREFMPERPGLRVVESIAAHVQKSSLEYLDTQTTIIRILFVQDNRLAEGLIAITTVPAPEFRSTPGSTIGMGYMLYGLTAPKGELSAKLPAMLDAGRSFKLEAEYEKRCRNERTEYSPTLLPEGYSLRHVLDAMALIWEKRLPTEDILVEKKADSLRGVERLYKSSTGEVYEFPLGFGAEYLAQPDRYNLNNLRPLPDDPLLWLKIPLNGSIAVTKK